MFFLNIAVIKTILNKLNTNKSSININIQRIYYFILFKLFIYDNLTINIPISHKTKNMPPQNELIFNFLYRP